MMTTTRLLQFRELPIGAKFLWMRDDPDSPEIAYRLKTGVRTFDIVSASGNVVGCGLVGTGDNPVEVRG